MPPQVDRLSLGPIGTNCYVVRPDRDADQAVVVDPSGSETETRLALASMGTRCAAILVTHAHFDHILGLADLAEGTGAPVYAPAAERVAIESPASFAPPGVAVRPWADATWLEGGETLELARVTFDVVSVPGHSPGHLAYAIEGALLSGDVLFAGSVGRTDLPGAGWPTLVDSIRRLLAAYAPETAVYPGHGPETTLAAELRTNPFLTELRAEQHEAAG